MSQENPSAPPSSSSRWIAIAISAIFSLGTILLLFREIDFDEFLTQLRNADMRYLLAMLVTYPIGMTVRAYRWQLLFEKHLDYWRGFHIINIGYMFNAVLPFRLGEFTRIILISREPEQNMGTGLSAVTVERLFDLILALLCVGIGLALIPDSTGLPQDTATTLGFLIVVTIVASLVIIFLPPIHPYLIRLVRFFASPLPNSIGSKLVTFAEDTLNSLKAIASPRKLAALLFWSVLTWASYVLFFYIGLFGFFDETLPIGIGFLVTGFVAVGIAAPSLPGAIGLFQAAAVLALRTAGYDTTIATSYAWTLWITQTVVIVLGGAIGLWAMSLSFRRLAEDVQSQH